MLRWYLACDLRFGLCDLQTHAARRTPAEEDQCQREREENHCESRPPLSPIVSTARCVLLVAGWTSPFDHLLLSFGFPSWIPDLCLKRGVCISSSVHFSSKLFIFSAAKRRIQARQAQSVIHDPVRCHHVCFQTLQRFPIMFGSSLNHFYNLRALNGLLF